MTSLLPLFLLLRWLRPALPLLLAAVLFAPAALSDEECESGGNGNGECEAPDLQPETAETIEVEGADLELEPEETIEEAAAACTDVQCLASVLASSVDFVEDYFEKKPLLLHLDPSFLGDARMNWEDVVSLIGKGLPWGAQGHDGLTLAGGQFASPDSNPSESLKGTLSSRSQFDGPAALPAAKTSTTHIGAVQAVHEGVANLTLTFQRTMGHAANANIYMTPPGRKTAAHLHTDRLDGYVFQTAGAERWTVHAPLPEMRNPVWGVHGNAEWGKGGRAPIPKDMTGEAVADVVLRPGDVLYVPRGFPRATSTIVGTDDAEHSGEDAEYSVAVTVSLHTEALHLVQEKVLRCAFAKAGYCEELVPNGSGDRYCPIGVYLSRYARTERGRASRESLPLGFLNPGGQWFGFVAKMAKPAEGAMRSVLELAEEEGGGRGIEDLMDDPKNWERLDAALAEVAGAVFQSQVRDLAAIEGDFAPRNAKVPFGERQRRWMRLFGRLGAFQGKFCHEGGARVFFKDYFSPELSQDALSSRMDRISAS